MSNANACELDGVSGPEQLRLLRKPVIDDGARFVTGFGPRVDPILRQRRMHAGIDWAAAIDSPVIAAAPGRVLSVGTFDELGESVTIDHGGGWRTKYGHLGDASRAVGDCVKRGDVVGRVGRTGLAGGPMLHFEIHKEGQPIDPLSVLP